MTDQRPLDVPWDRKPEPEEVMHTDGLSSKRAIVTGGYSGIGLEAVKALAGQGAQIIVPARSRQKAEEALSGIKGVTVADMDLADIASVRKFASDIGGQPLDLLINNAGIMVPPLERVGPGWESQFGINHMGHFALTTELLPALRKAEAPRVVALSSLAHRRTGIIWDDPHFNDRPYDKWEGYGQSKTANALFARALDQREESISAYSVHPGGIMTDLQRNMPKKEQIAMGWLNEDGTIPEAVAAFFKSPAQGTATTLWAATSPMLEGHGGVYCEDCNIAALAPDDDQGFFGVRSWACSDDEADKLWHLSEKLLAS
ncbi:SDR family NAD(P)-dependent oxidoreductase [Parvularcula sp. ZS-1/3]|uniref:Probable oxidoreductase n=1 Tax=Parvularcula mediterranea TaxID=2732508 RepID=A0A7Y3W4M2_9PROT|nr:SDR family NAD(P)-dependent oxidoreductase [Parvularcula mediterranea]NNU15669.1 SDR family NAD(P)-dependent oxidoreductase [Parvularcula mediterranea]